MAQRNEETEQLKVPESTLAISRQPNCTLDASATVHSSASPKAGQPASSPRETTAALLGRESVVTVPASPPVVGTNRCAGCRKKVGLVGFRCRCGGVFCAEHRYSDRHVCSFDYKAAAREEIARTNPVVKAAKIVRI